MDFSVESQFYISVWVLIFKQNKNSAYLFGYYLPLQKKSNPKEISDRFPGFAKSPQKALRFFINAID